MFSGEIFDFYDKTLRFKTVVKLENQPREKIREWFKALDRSKVFEGFEMFVCVIIGFGDYYGFYGSDEEFIPFIEIYKHTKDKFGNKPKVIFVDIIHVHVNRGITMSFFQLIFPKYDATHYLSTFRGFFLTKSTIIMNF